MAVTFSEILPARSRGGGAFHLKAIDLTPTGDRASPVLLLDDFRVTNQPFPPHPHAGFSAVTYVFEDSAGALRSRDSLGHDVIVRAGGLVWTQAGRGILHQEVPVDDGELHGLQLFVNLSAANKLVPPQMQHLDPADVPLWTNEAGDRVRVVVGQFGGLTSPLVPTEPFLFLDARLKRGITVGLPEDHNATLYLLAGEVLVRSGGDSVRVRAGQALVLSGGGDQVALDGAAHLILLAGGAQRGPVVNEGPFIMSDRAQIVAAIGRYRSGEMGQLAPLPPR